MVMPDIVTLIANTGGTLGLAIFAIWMLQRSHKEHEARWREERRELLDTIERNTSAWVEASKQLAIIVEKVNGKK